MRPRSGVVDARDTCILEFASIAPAFRAAYGKHAEASEHHGRACDGGAEQGKQDDSRSEHAGSGKHAGGTSERRAIEDERDKRECGEPACGGDGFKHGVRFTSAHRGHEEQDSCSGNRSCGACGTCCACPHGASHAGRAEVGNRYHYRDEAHARQVRERLRIGEPAEWKPAIPKGGKRFAEG